MMDHSITFVFYIANFDKFTTQPNKRTKKNFKTFLFDAIFEFVTWIYCDFVFCIHFKRYTWQCNYVCINLQTFNVAFPSRGRFLFCLLKFNLLCKNFISFGECYSFLNKINKKFKFIYKFVTIRLILHTKQHNLRHLFFRSLFKTEMKEIFN